MANSSDVARWRRSFQEMVSLGGAAIAPLRRALPVMLSALSDNAQVAFKRHLDGGYDPGTLDKPGRRGRFLRCAERFGAFRTKPAACKASFVTV